MRISLLLVILVVACRGASPTTSAPPAPAPVSVPETSAPEVPALPVESGALRLEGQVVDADHQPLAGALVSVNHTRAAHTEADGSFAFDGLVEGEYVLAAELGDRYAEDTARLTEWSDPATLVLASGAALVVHVVDARTRAPIAGATVKTSNRSATTGADGSARLRCLDAGYESVDITAPGHAPARRAVVTDDPAATLAEDVALEPAAVLGGIVLGDDGKPVAEAKVSVTTADRACCDDATTDAAGRWHVDLVGPGHHTVTASSELDVATPELVVEHDGITARTDLVVHVTRGGQITGVVVDAHGTPVPDARVQTGWGSDSTDDHGRFRVRGIPAGEYEVIARTDTGYARAEPLKLATGGHADIRLVLGGDTLAGIVVDARGAAIDDAIVVAHAKIGADVSTRITFADERGHFDFGGVEAGDYEINAQRHEESARDVPAGRTVHSGDRDVRIVLPDTGTITGRVTLAGAPVAFFGFVVADSPEHTRHARPEAVRGDGHFIQKNLAPGRYAVVIVGPDFVRRTIESIDVAPGARIDLGDIAVDRGRSLSGRVVDDTGAPVANAAVHLFESTHRSPAGTLERRMSGEATTRTDAAGRYHFDGIGPEADKLQVAAEHGTAISTERPLGADSTIDLVLHRTGTITGRVTGEAHMVYATGSESELELGFVETDGTFHIDHLIAGRYELTADNGPATVVTVVAGESARVTLAAH